MCHPLHKFSTKVVPMSFLLHQQNNLTLAASRDCLPYRQDTLNKVGFSKIHQPLFFFLKYSLAIALYNAF